MASKALPYETQRSRREPLTETRFGRSSRIALAAVPLMLGLDLAQIGYRLSLPSNGWTFPKIPVQLPAVVLGSDMSQEASIE